MSWRQRAELVSVFKFKYNRENFQVGQPFNCTVFYFIIVPALDIGTARIKLKLGFLWHPGDSF